MNKFIFRSIRIIRRSLFIGTEKLDKIDEKLENVIKLLEEKENHDK